MKNWCGILKLCSVRTPTIYVTVTMDFKPADHMMCGNVF